MGDLGATADRVPVGPIDQMYVGVGVDHPWTVHAEVRVPASLDRDRLAAAAVEALRVHPMLRAHLDPDRQSWIVPPVAGPVPVDVAAAAERPLGPWRDALVGDTADMPHGRAVRFAAYDHGDGTTTLLVVAHHAAVDGGGARVALGAWAAACHSPLGAPDESWREARALAAPAVSAERRRETAAGLRALIAARPVPVAPAGGTDGAVPVYGVATVATVLPPGWRTAVPGATASDVVVAGAVLALQQHNRRWGAPTTPMVVGVPVNLRRPAHRDGGVGNASLPWPVRIDAEEPGAVLAAVVAGVAPVRAGLLATPVRALLAELREAGRPPLWMRVGLAALSTTISTMGQSTVPWPGHPPAPAWGGAPAAPWTGATLAAAQAGDDLHLSIRHLRAVLGEPEARAVLEGWVAALDVLVPT